MTYSLGEIEALARKAARGAGYEWGIADETGRAVRWLAAFDLPGADLLLFHLRHLDDADLSPQGPSGLGNWSSPDGPLCPLMTGASLADCASLLPEAGLIMGKTFHPLLLLPFAAQVARARGHGVSLEWKNGLCLTDGELIEIELPALSADCAPDVRLAFDPPPIREPVYPATRGRVSDAVWAGLSHFASRTYAPATEASRAGAGAGIHDSD